MSFRAEARMALDPQYCLRNDVDRAVLVTRPQPLSIDKPSVTRLVHPREAVLLALLDGERTLGQAAELWSEVTRRPPEAALAEVERVVRRYTEGEAQRYGFLVEVDEGNRGAIRRYDPLDFVIPAKDVDLRDSRLRKPYLVYLLPTLFCPQKCIYCYAKTCPRPEAAPIGLARLKEIFAELRQIGVEVVQMSGGDPFARRGIFEIIRAIFDAGMVPDLPTKLGIGRRQAVELKQMGVRLVQVSLDSADPAVLDRMVGVEGYHLRVFKVLEDLRSAGLSVRVNTVLTPFNAPTIGGLLDLLGEMGNVVRVTLTPYGRSLFCHRDELFLSPSDLARIAEDAERRVERFPHMHIIQSGWEASALASPEEKAKRWRERAACTANRHGFIILPDGRVTVCEELYDHPSFIIGDLKRQSVMEMWSSPEALSLLRPDQASVPEGPCKSCAVYDECNLGRGRCWRDVLKAYGWERPYYPDPRCPEAPPGNRVN